MWDDFFSGLLCLYLFMFALIIFYYARKMKGTMKQSLSWLIFVSTGNHNALCLKILYTEWDDAIVK